MVAEGRRFLHLVRVRPNNQQDTRVNFFFGTFWQAPTVLVVLTSFALGVAIGVLGMVPRWWRQRQAARRAQEPLNHSTPTPQEPPVGA